MIGYTSERIGDWVLLRDNYDGVLFSADARDVLGFLRRTIHSDAIEPRFVWDLGTFIAPVLRLLPVELVIQLVKTSKAVHCGVKLFYLQDRMIGVGDASIYALKQFFPTDEVEPVGAGEVASKGQELDKALVSMGVKARGYTSPLSVVRRYYIEPKHLDLPTIWDINDGTRLGIAQYAFNCDRNMWLENYQIGSWGEGEAFDYDVTSSYPFQATQVGDIRDASFLFSKRMIEDAHAGLLRGKIHVNKGGICPLTTARENDTYFNPCGDWQDFVTLDEVRFLYRWGLGSFELKDGWFIKYRSAKRPYAELMNEIYRWRKLGRIPNFISKRASVSLVGNQIRRVDKFTDNDHYNDEADTISHALITSRSRMWMAGQLMNYDVKPSEIISFEIDGFRLNRELPLPKLNLLKPQTMDKDLPPMGTLRYAGSPAVVIYAPTKIFTLDKNPSGQGVTISRLVDAINESPNKTEYKFTTKRMVQPSALFNDANARVGDMVDYTTGLDLRNLDDDQNRVFPKLPHTGRALLSNKYQSEPIVV